MSAAPERAAAPALVIGYGSELRGDDAAGQRVAEALAAREPPGVRVIAVHQLAPELAPELARTRLVIFVDARLPGDGDGIELRAVTPGDSWLGHASSPAWLLALAERLYGARPEAWLVTIPTAHTAIGRPLSGPALRGVDDALRAVGQLLRRAGAASG